MKIITVNIPESYVNAIEKLCGDNKIYPSRSELIRVAVREFVIEKLRLANKFQKLAANTEEETELLFDDEEDVEATINIPFQNSDSDAEVGVVYKTFKKI